jgi:hypothetical protein
MSDGLEASPSTVGEGGARLWLYPDRRGGVFANRRKVIAIALIVFYLLAPYITIGGEPFVRINVLAARISLLGYSFRYTDASFVFFAFALPYQYVLLFFFFLSLLVFLFSFWVLFESWFVCFCADLDQVNSALALLIIEICSADASLDEVSKIKSEA